MIFVMIKIKAFEKHCQGVYDRRLVGMGHGKWAFGNWQRRLIISQCLKPYCIPLKTELSRYFRITCWASYEPHRMNIQQCPSGQEILYPAKEGTTSDKNRHIDSIQDCWSAHNDLREARRRHIRENPTRRSNVKGSTLLVNWPFQNRKDNSI